MEIFSVIRVDRMHSHPLHATHSPPATALGVGQFDVLVSVGMIMAILVCPPYADVVQRQRRLLGLV